MDDDGDDKDDTKRRSRNLSEKKRRDQFNMLVTELSTLITSNNRKMDKSTILKSTITFLKNHNEETVRSRAHDVQENWKPTFLTNEEFTYLILEALEGFVLVFSASGRIHYASDSIFPLLGHNSADIVNKSIFELTLEDDRRDLYNLLQSTTSSAEHTPGSCTENELLRFQIHLKRGSQDRNDTSYDLVEFYGHSRTGLEQIDDDPVMMNQQDSDSRVIFICIGRLHTPQLISNVSLVDSSRNEFTSRHSLEWKFLFLDHRAPPIIGYLPFEVLGTSGYDYYHFDDLEKVVTYHEALMQKGELTSGYYRFLTKGQQWIWLKTRFYITYHQWNSKPEFVVCTHEVISHAEVIKSLKDESVDQADDVIITTEIEKKIVDPSKDPIRPMSPPFLSEPASDAYANTYQSIPQITLINSKSSVSELQPLTVKDILETLLSNDDASLDKTPLNDAPLDKMPLNDASLDKTLLNDASLDKTPLNDALLDKIPLNESPLDKRLLNDALLDKTLLNDALLDKTLLNDVLLDKTPLNAAPLDKSLKKNLEPQLPPLYKIECVSDGIVDCFRIVEQECIMTTVQEIELSTLDLDFENSPSSIQQVASVKSAASGSTTGNVASCDDAEGSGASWTQALTSYTAGSDTASQLEDSCSPQRNPELETRPTEASLMPQHGMDAQYLNSACSYSSVPVPENILPVTTMQPTPVLARSDKGQVQEQLQRKHEELQQMIVRQQEELRLVKEQLMLARFGMLQPMDNVPNPYSPTEGMQNQQLLPQIEYANAAPTLAITYPQQAPVQQPSQSSLLPLPLLPLQPTQLPSTTLLQHATEPHLRRE